MYEYGGGGYHCVYFDDKDFEIFQKRQLTAVTCPASNLKLASGIAPLKRFVEEGIPVALGTDGPASNNSLDMFKEMFLASALAKVREMDAELSLLHISVWKKFIMQKKRVLSSIF